MPPRLASPPKAALLSLALFAWAPAAFGLENQWRAGVDLLGGALSGPNDGQLGVGGGAHLAYGVNDWLNLELSLSGTRHLEGGPSIFGATAAAYYTIDVIEWIPYLGLFAGGYRFTGDEPSTSLGGGLALGLDYQFDRNYSVGIQGRLHEVFAPDPFGATAYGTLALRAEYVWGF